MKCPVCEDFSFDTFWVYGEKTRGSSNNYEFEIRRCGILC